MRWSRQTLRARDNEFKGRDAAGRVLSGEQEAHSERTETDGPWDGLTRRLMVSCVMWIPSCKKGVLPPE